MESTFLESMKKTGLLSKLRLWGHVFFNHWKNNHSELLQCHSKIPLQNSITKCITLDIGTRVCSLSGCQNKRQKCTFLRTTNCLFPRIENKQINCRKQKHLVIHHTIMTDKTCNFGWTEGGGAHDGVIRRLQLPGGKHLRLSMLKINHFLRINVLEDYLKLTPRWIMVENR